MYRICVQSRVKAKMNPMLFLYQSYNQFAPYVTMYREYNDKINNFIIIHFVIEKNLQDFKDGINVN